MQTFTLTYVKIGEDRMNIENEISLSLQRKLKTNGKE